MKIRIERRLFDTGMLYPAWQWMLIVNDQGIANGSHIDAVLEVVKLEMEKHEALCCEHCGSVLK